MKEKLKNIETEILASDDIIYSQPKFMKKNTMT